MDTDKSDKLFCEVGSDLGYLSPEVISRALEKQRSDRSSGVARPIGEYFLDAGIITPDQLGQILKLQTKYRIDPDSEESLFEMKAQISPKTPGKDSSSANSNELFVDADFSVMSLVWMVFLTIITSGIYLPFWFLIQAKGLNQLNSKEKIEAGPLYIYVFLMIAINIVAALFLDVSGAVIVACALGLLFKESAKTRRILMEHFNPTGQGDFIISENAGSLPFVLQHRINQLKIDPKRSAAIGYRGYGSSILFSWLLFVLIASWIASENEALGTNVKESSVIMSDKSQKIHNHPESSMIATAEKTGQETETEALEKAEVAEKSLETFTILMKDTLSQEQIALINELAATLGRDKCNPAFVFDGIAQSDNRKYYSIQGGAVYEDHLSTHSWYRIDPDSGEIFTEDMVECQLVTTGLKIPNISAFSAILKSNPEEANQKIGDDTGTVNAQSGAALRESPSRAAKKLAVVTNATQIRILNKNGPVETIDNTTANWFFVGLPDGRQGWVFGGLIQTTPGIEGDSEEEDAESIYFPEDHEASSEVSTSESTFPPEGFGTYGGVFRLTEVVKALGIENPIWEKVNDNCYILRNRFVDALTRAETETAFVFEYQSGTMVQKALTITRIAVNGIERSRFEVEQFNQDLQKKLVYEPVQNFNPNDPQAAIKQMEELMRRVGESLGKSGIR